MQVFDQEFLAATEGELYLGAKSWCLANTSNEPEALKLFLDKFVAKITPEYMSQRDFLTCVANDAFLGQVHSGSDSGTGRVMKCFCSFF